ncbi:MAG: SDR family NAD(P)-dependent oxidoreductase, partial [Hyphomicrobiales bacterium]|nr:SDR family NAD(P)-dependent oxidoreductase [Hyphomicrobiales bacterium]
MAAAALVTGAGKRIGAAIAAALATEGFAVALHHRASGAEAGRLASELRAKGARAVALAADLEDPRAVAGLVPAARAALGPLTLLVNSASVFEPDAAGDDDPATWRRHFAVNLEAPVALSRAFAAQAPDGGGASIVNLLDQKVLRLDPTHFSYTLSKAALWTATQTMAQAFAPRVRVNAIAPGP